MEWMDVRICLDLSVRHIVHPPHCITATSSTARCSGSKAPRTPLARGKQFDTLIRKKLPLPLFSSSSFLLRLFVCQLVRSQLPQQSIQDGFRNSLHPRGTYSRALNLNLLHLRLHLHLRSFMSVVTDWSVLSEQLPLYCHQGCGQGKRHRAQHR